MTSLFPNPVVYLFHVLYDDRCWSEILCSTIPHPVYDFKVKVTDLEFLYWNFVFKFLQCLFLCSLHVWHGDRNWSKILYDTILNPVHDFYVKVKDLEFLHKSFVINCSHFFAKSSMDFIHIWHDDRALSKILRSTIHIPVHDLKAKNTDFEFLQSLWLVWIVFGMNGYKILQCYRKEKRDFRRAVLSGDRSYYKKCSDWEQYLNFAPSLHGLGKLFQLSGRHRAFSRNYLWQKYHVEYNYLSRSCWR